MSTQISASTQLGRQRYFMSSRPVQAIPAAPCLVTSSAVKMRFIHFALLLCSEIRWEVRAFQWPWRWQKVLKKKRACIDRASNELGCCVQLRYPSAQKLLQFYKEGYGHRWSRWMGGGGAAEMCHVSGTNFHGIFTFELQITPLFPFLFPFFPISFLFFFFSFFFSLSFLFSFPFLFPFPSPPFIFLFQSGQYTVSQPCSSWALQPYWPRYFSTLPWGEYRAELSLVNPHLSSVPVVVHFISLPPDAFILVRFKIKLCDIYLYP